ncbi:hypothetical protein ACOSQ4_021273 [Xanthoceras sorbifolium]
MTLEAQLAILIDQMNENSERLRALEAENKDLQNKLDTMATTTTPPPGFGHKSLPWRNRSISSLKYGSRCLSDRTSSQRAHDT